MAADASCQPIFLSVQTVRKLSGEAVAPEECSAILECRSFRTAYTKFLEWHTSSGPCMSVFTAMPRPGYLLRMILPVKTQCRRHRRVMEVILLKQKQIKCPYCHAHASLRPASLVYGSTPQTRGKFLYVCDRWPACNAYVSAHERTLLPMGTLANGDLRHKRILAHRALKKLQQDCHMEKWEVYIWLQAKLGLDAHQTHIGQFSEYMCEQVISLCQQAPAYTSGRAA